MTTKEIKNKVSKQFDDLIVTAEFEDTPEHFRFRLVCGDCIGEWSKYYEDINTIEFDCGRKFGLATQYWTGKLPTEVPFEIVQGK